MINKSITPILMTAFLTVQLFSFGQTTTFSNYLRSWPSIGSSLNWWEKETEMKNDKLTFSDKSWFSRAKAMNSGQSFYVYLDNDLDPDLLILKEGEMIVEVVDDDDDMASGDKYGDKDSDCYVVDQNGDGSVDRMVDYINNNGDNKADEMEIRYYYDGGELRYVWLAEDLDKDGKMWGLNSAYEYDGNFYNSDGRGNNIVYLNKYNPETDTWVPLSEDPFSFHDLDADGESEATIRMAVALADYDPGRDGRDYANDLGKIAIPRIAFDKSKMSIVNIRYSYDLDNDSTSNNPYDYDFGFTMTGSLPYDNSGFNNLGSQYTNLKRRLPKTVFRVPQQNAIKVADSYQASQTGFSWDEYDTNDRWEGIFWTWDWHALANTGGPTQKWNMRREFNPNPAGTRKLYYSEIDKRIHLFGATEGLMEIGDIFKSEPVIRIRYYDTDRNGFFDRWEIDLNGDKAPERVIQAPDEKVRLIPLDYNSLSKFYITEVLPTAIKEDEDFINNAEQILGETPLRIQKWKNLAQSVTSPEQKRFLLDIVRELYASEL